MQIHRTNFLFFQYQIHLEVRSNQTIQTCVLSVSLNEFVADSNAMQMKTFSKDCKV